MADRTVVVCDVCGALDASSVTLKAGPRTAQKDLCAKHMAELFSGSRKPRRGRLRGPQTSAAKRTTSKKGGLRAKRATQSKTS
jgi:hypothetical protein